TRWPRDWSSDVCSSDLGAAGHLLTFDVGILNGDDLQTRNVVQIALASAQRRNRKIDRAIGDRLRLDQSRKNAARLLPGTASQLEIGRASCRERVYIPRG